jgi:hypothetical protein
MISSSSLVGRLPPQSQESALGAETNGKSCITAALVSIVAGWQAPAARPFR